MSLVLPSTGTAAAGMEPTKPSLAHRSCLDYIEATILQHMLDGKKLDVPLASGKTVMELTLDLAVDGFLRTPDTLELLGYLRQEGLRLHREDGGVMVLNRILRATSMNIKDKVELAEYMIIRGGSNRNQMDRESREDALFAAVADPICAKDCVSMLLRVSPPEPLEFTRKATNADGQTVLTKLVAHLEKTEDPELLQQIQDTVIMLCTGDIQMEPGELIPALVLAAGNRQCCPDVVQLIHDAVDVDLNATMGDLNQTAMHISAARGLHGLVETLARAGAQIDSTDNNGDTALILACRTGETRTIGMLLGLGANPNRSSQTDGTPLHAAVRSLRVQVVEELLRSNKCVDIDPGELDADEAVDSLHWPIGINEPDKDKNTVLDIVIQAEQSGESTAANAELCKILLAKNAKTASTGPLHQLIKQVCNSSDTSHEERVRNAAVVVMLLDANDGERKLIDPNDQVDGVTPLDLLVWKPIGTIMQALLRAGAVLEEGLIQRMLRSMASEDCTTDKFDRILESIAILTEGDPPAPVGEARRPCTCGENGELTLLQLAIKLQLKEVVDVLVTNGVDVNENGAVFYAFKMLSKAMMAGDGVGRDALVFIVRLLFEPGTVDCNLPAHEDLNEERTLLELALAPDGLNEVETLKFVLGDPGSVNVLRANPNEPSDAPPLRMLFEELLSTFDAGGFEARVEFLLSAATLLVESGAKVDHVIHHPDGVFSPLKIALHMQEWELAKTLIQVGNADINFLNPFYDHVVVHYCNPEVEPGTKKELFQILTHFFDNGADHKTVNVGDPPALELAWTSGEWDLAKKLILKGADIHSTQLIFRVMEKLVEARQGQEDKGEGELQDFLDFIVRPGSGVQGVDLNMLDARTDKSALSLAIELNDEQLVESLLNKHKANGKEPGLLLNVMNQLAEWVIAGALEPSAVNPSMVEFYDHVALLLLNSGATLAFHGATPSATPTTTGSSPWFNTDRSALLTGDASWELRTNWSCLDYAILTVSENLLNECMERMSQNLARHASDLGRTLSKVFLDLKLFADTPKGEKPNVDELMYGPAVTRDFLLEVLQELVEHGAMEHLPITLKQTPFEIAVQLQDEELCEFLMQQKADVSTHTPLFAALEEYFTSDDFASYMKPHQPRIKFVYWVAEELMLHNPKLLNAKSANGRTALELAIGVGDLAYAEKMVRAGAEVNAISYLSQILQLLVAGTQNMVAGPKQFRAFAHLLIKEGADVNPELPRGRNSPLQCAVQLRDQTLIEKLLEKGADVTSSPLFPITVQYACDAANLEDDAAEQEIEYQMNLIDSLLEHRADIEQIGPSGKTSLEIALKANCVELIELLLKKDAKFHELELMSVLESLRSEYDPRSGYGAESQEQIAKLLVEHDADVNVCVDNVEPLELAVEALHLEMVQLLVKAGAHLRNENAGNPLFALFTPLHHALSADNSQIVRKCSMVADYLIEKGADPHVLHSVLDMSISQDDSDQLIVGMVTFFGNKGARLNELTPDGSLLLRCAQQGLVLSVDALIDLGAPVRQSLPDGSTALSVAIQNNQTQCAAILLENGANAKDLKSEGDTPMVHQSVLHGDVVLLQLLAKSSGASLKKITDKFGRTVLHYVLCQQVGSNSGDSAEMLASIEAAANPAAADCQGDTPLHIVAAGHAVQSVLKIASLRGSDVTANNLRGWSCVDVAAMRGNSLVFEALLQRYPVARAVPPETVAICAGSSFVKGLELCAKHGVDSWDTALWTACFMGRLDSMVYTIRQGADVNQRDAQGHTILHWLPAWHSRNPSYVVTLAKPLMEADANILLVDQNDSTALHSACRYQNASYAKMLVDAGASTYAEDCRGFKALNSLNAANAEQVAQATGMPLPDGDSLMFRDVETGVGWGLLTQRPNYRPDRFAAVEWCRVSELKPASSALSSNPDGPMLASDVELGRVAVDSLTASFMQGCFGNDLSGLFVTRQSNSQGKYTLQLPDVTNPGCMTEVVVDDMVPCIQGAPCFVGLAKDGTFWPVILRKAFAKLWGAYDAPPPYFMDVTGVSTAPQGRLNSQDESRAAADEILQGLAQIFCCKEQIPQASAPNVLVKLPQTHYLEPGADKPNVAMPYWQGWLSNLQSYRMKRVAQVVVEAKPCDSVDDPVFIAAAFRPVSYTHLTLPTKRIV
eukprot:TRINITY_DN6609_c0_g1_i2.p1 TRINITY_DN6609_c0_g1~~TRINITY_DN6609_c0_g1_i2.p1  ORF type:complete len:2149 (+),score=422.35 TRINITY_DN6609_c0_g1_i2:160-6606(+)